MTRFITQAISGANEAFPHPAVQLRSAVEALLRWHRRRRDARYLAGLSDHQLKDIGLSRGAISAAVRGRLR